MLTEQECRDILGVTHHATQDDIIAARRRLARVAHPDSGGDHLQMVTINEACRILLAAAAGHNGSRETTQAEEKHRTESRRQRDDGRLEGAESRRHGFRDVPSFVINALPVEAFETLVVSAANLGEVVDEDPPYLLEVLVREPGPLWCRFELFPDAGSTTVMLSCDVEAGYRVYSVEEIRDLWISTINASTSNE